MRRRRQGRGGAEGRPRPSALPAAGQIVTVTLGARSWTTRVEAVGPRRVEVVAPTRRRAGPILPEPGTGIELSWTTAVGKLAGEGSVVGTGEDVVATWIVELGNVERHQRRRAYREQVPVLLVLSWRDRQVDTRTCDLSEGGAGVVLPAGSAPRDGEHVHVVLTLGDEQRLASDAEVVRVRELPHLADEPRLVEVGLAFVGDDPERTETLRRFVFEEQLRRRASR